MDDLPPPLGPTRATTWPGATSKLNPRSTCDAIGVSCCNAMQFHVIRMGVVGDKTWMATLNGARHKPSHRTAKQSKAKQAACAPCINGNSSCAYRLLRSSRVCKVHAPELNVAPKLRRDLTSTSVHLCITMWHTSRCVNKQCSAKWLAPSRCGSAAQRHV
jgi:hypothetical protein